jgi:hypothetical protein
LLTTERKQHLEIAAESRLAQAYYTEHISASRDYWELFDTFYYILEALFKRDSLPDGHSPLMTDSLVNPEADDSTS